MVEYHLSNPEHIYWVKETQHIMVVDERIKQVTLLCDLQAALWSWISLSYSFEQLCHLVAKALDLDNAGARGMILEIFKEWEEIGIISLRTVENG